jgi:hypothetical protein
MSLHLGYAALDSQGIFRHRVREPFDPLAPDLSAAD